MSGLRFAMVTTFYPPHHFGGDGAYVRRLTHALARRGHRVDVLHDVDAFRILHQGPEPEALEEPTGVTVHPFESRVPGLSCLATQQLGLPLEIRTPVRRHLRELVATCLDGAPVRVAEHCWGCTAGQGSSCGGALESEPATQHASAPSCGQQ